MAACLMAARFVLLWNVFMTVHGSFVLVAIPVAFWTTETLPVFRNADNLTAPCNMRCSLIFSVLSIPRPDRVGIWTGEAMSPSVVPWYWWYQWNHTLQLMAGAASGTNKERQELQPLLQVGSCQCLQSDVGKNKPPFHRHESQWC